MSTLVKLRSRAQITLPKETVRMLNLKEGDNLSIEVDDGKVIITPVVVIPKDELWAWSTDMRNAIEEGKREAKKGKLKEYSTPEDLWKELPAAEKED